MKALAIPGLALLVIVGVFFGVSAYTFYYARGYSYLSNDPNACINCHVMREKFDAWQVGPHRFASCNDCHVPQDFFGKYAVKMEHGLRHSYVFTFGNPQIFGLKESGYKVVENNCVRCHATTVSTIMHGGEGQRRCFQCHTGIGHAF